VRVVRGERGAGRVESNQTVLLARQQRWTMFEPAGASMFNKSICVGFNVYI
jgi:hypothetical protein